MSTDVVVIDEIMGPLEQLKPRFQQVLEPYSLPAPRLMQTIRVSLERTPKLLTCARQSIINAAMSAAVLGLEVDGITGQGFLVPFRSTKLKCVMAQLIVGYKGYNTMAGRNGFTINGAAVYEGDEFKYRLGSRPYLDHEPCTKPGRLTHTWAVANSKTMPLIGPVVMTATQIEAIRARSPGAKMDDSPWRDPHIGYPAMGEKCPKRRLARAMPLGTMVLAAAMEETFEERGLGAALTPEGGMLIEGEGKAVFPERQGPEAQPKAEEIQARAFEIQRQNKTESFKTIEQWGARMREIIGAGRSEASIEKLIKVNGPGMDSLRKRGYEPMVADVLEIYGRKLRSFDGTKQQDKLL